MYNTKIQQLMSWAKTHKLVLFLGLVVIVLFAKNNSHYMPMSRNAYTMSESARPEMALSYDSAEMSAGLSKRAYPVPMPPIYPGESVDVYKQDRKVVRNSDMSLLVKNVRETVDQIVSQTTSVGGFMVSSSVQTPDQGGSGTLTIRVPSTQLDNTLAYLRGISVKVVSESVTGNDVTDQYTDTEARLATLTKTKATFEAMMDKTESVDEILKVQQSIFQVQDQIDGLKGQLEYLKNTSQSSLISIYLSTDELALPYSPSEPWRPNVVFKTAVRSLLSDLRKVGNIIIWGVVYSPILIVLVIIGLLIKRKMK